MIKALHGVHKGATIAVVGSGPTATEFLKGRADISIGVNGAAKLGKRFDYFMCGDAKSSCFDWFNVECSKIRIIAKLTAALDKILYPLELYPDIKRIAVTTPRQGTVKLPPPAVPHLTFMYKWYKPQRLTNDMDFLMFGGTISCCAVQLAYLMGAAKVVLYGCGFGGSRQHYFYRTRRVGTVSESQRSVMNAVIKDLRERGVRFEIVGDTTLNPV